MSQPDYFPEDDLSPAAWSEIWAQEALDRSMIKHGKITETAREHSRNAAWHGQYQRQLQQY